MALSGGAYPKIILKGIEEEYRIIIERSMRKPTSKITQEIGLMKGYGTLRVLNFLNNLCSQITDCRYLEFGVWCGRSLSAAAYNNEGIFIGVDNFKGIDIPAAPPSRVDIKSELTKNITGRTNITFHEMNCLEFPAQDKPFNIFFYDADHDVSSTATALYHASKTGLLTNPCILIIDDYDSKHWNVPEGLELGLKLGKYDICQSWVLPKLWGYHEGLWVGIVKSNAG